VDAAVATRADVLAYLRQRADEPASFEDSRSRLVELAGKIQTLQAGRSA
jgi:hypothetical protein